MEKFPKYFPVSFDCVRGRQNTLNEIVIKIKWSVKSKIWKKEEKVSKFEISVKIEKILLEENVRWNQCWLQSYWNIFPWSWLLKIWWRKTKKIYAKSINTNLRISFYEQIEFIFVRQLKSRFVNDSVYLWVTANNLLKKNWMWKKFCFTSLIKTDAVQQKIWMNWKTF